MPLLLFCGILFPGLARADGALTAQERTYSQQYGSSLVCDVLNADLSIRGIRRVVQLIEVHGPWSEQSAKRIADTAIYTLCPEFAAPVRKIVDQANRQQLA
jgi:hypothetical protein